MIPAKSNRREPIPHDRQKYKLRNLVERLFNKLKNWRRIATRYDKTKESYLGFVSLVSVRIFESGGGQERALSPCVSRCCR